MRYAFKTSPTLEMCTHVELNTRERVQYNKNWKSSTLKSSMNSLKSKLYKHSLLLE